MPSLITETMFGTINTISIPTDAIFMISSLIIFILIVYLFNNFINNATNQLTQKKDIDSNLEIADHLRLEAIKLDQKNGNPAIMKKVNFLLPSKLMGFGSLAFLAMGGASLLGLQHMQKSYQGINTSRTNIKLENQSTKSPLSLVSLKTLDKTQTNIKKIHYVDPFISTIKSSKNNHYYQIKETQIEKNFFF